ncbi:MAG: septum site-determining protein MinC [Lachnospiraceae bacterium]|nr:septum site-determining protein MinC [Lachnospiraceae bacterium]
MEQPVVIKSNKYGLTVCLDSEPDFETLKGLVADKFAESKKFFKGAELAVAFEGRELTQDEQIILVQEMIANADIKVPCIVDVDVAREAVMKQAMEHTRASAEVADHGDGKFYKGTLRSGQVLESETSIVILGDVNPGATVVSKGNVVVLGTLKGSIYVGAGGNENTFVAALSMDPMQIRIADHIARNSDGPEKKDKKKLVKKKDKVDEQPMIAYVDAGNIYIEPITKEVLADINI